MSRTFCAVVLCLSVLAISGCGGSNHPTTQPPAPVAASPTPTPQPTPQPTPAPPTPTPTPDPADALIYTVVEQTAPHGEFGPNILLGWALRQGDLQPIARDFTGSLLPDIGEEIISISPRNRQLYVIARDETSLCHLYSFTILPDGHLTDTGARFKLGLTFTPMVFDPTGRFMFVTSDDGLHEFTIDPDTDNLTEFVDSPFPVGGAFFARGAVMTPSGKFLYVSAGANGLWAYSFDQQTGALDSIAGDPLVTGNFQVLNVDPSGSLLFVQNLPTESVQSYKIGVSGELQLQFDQQMSYGDLLAYAPFDPLTNTVYFRSFNNDLSFAELPFARLDASLGVPVLASESPLSIPEQLGDGEHMVTSTAMWRNRTLVVATEFTLYMLKLDDNGNPQLPPTAQINATDGAWMVIDELTVTH